VKPRRFPKSKLAHWRRSSLEALTSEVVAGRIPGPAPPREWAPALHQLTELARKPSPAPAWWTPMTAYFGSIETRTDPSSYYWDGRMRHCSRFKSRSRAGDISNSTDNDLDGSRRARRSSR